MWSTALRCIVLLGCLVVVQRAGAQDEQVKKNFARLREGMSEAEVKRLVGNPEVIERFRTVPKGTHDTTTYWRYENDLTILFLNHYLHKMEPDHNALLQRIQEWADPNNKEGIRLIYGKH
jgi:hypothetical protein